MESKENKLTQDYFISDDGYINIKLKITTDDKVEREKIVAELMGRLKNRDGFELPKNTSIENLYFSNQNPLTVLESVKKQIICDIEKIFDNSISMNN